MRHHDGKAQDIFRRAYPKAYRIPRPAGRRLAGAVGRRVLAGNRAKSAMVRARVLIRGITVPDDLTIRKRRAGRGSRQSRPG